MFRHAYCPDCDCLVDLELIRTHNLGSHPDDWLTLTWNKPLAFSTGPDPDVADQLDRVAQLLDADPGGPTSASGSSG